MEYKAEAAVISFLQVRGEANSVEEAALMAKAAVQQWGNGTGDTGVEESDEKHMDEEMSIYIDDYEDPILVRVYDDVAIICDR